MPQGKSYPQHLKEKVMLEVGAYQSEHKCSRRRACQAIGNVYSVKPDTIYKWFEKSRGRNNVISTVAKKRDKQQSSIKIAATSVSKASIEAEKIIFNHLKNLSLFKRILACIIGLDKLCMNYGYTKMD